MASLYLGLKPRMHLPRGPFPESTHRAEPQLERRIFLEGSRMTSSWMLDKDLITPEPSHPPASNPKLLCLLVLDSTQLFYKYLPSFLLSPQQNQLSFPYLGQLLSCKRRVMKRIRLKRRVAITSGLGAPDSHLSHRLGHRTRKLSLIPPTPKAGVVPLLCIPVTPWASFHRRANNIIFILLT